MSFRMAIQRALDAVRDRSALVRPNRWQSVDVKDKPEMETHEVLNHTLKGEVDSEDLATLAADIEPNLPWSDDHFLERVSGEPLNPGVQWARWPWGHSADKARHVEMPEGERGFSHTYMERFWPKHADVENRMLAMQAGAHGKIGYAGTPMTGIRYEYGDLADIVDHLAADPLSRQAYLPIFFPEDTGKRTVRVPCTLGYQFINRHGYLHCVYFIRSCDVYRHMRDDIYLTVRLQLWVLDQLRARDDRWRDVRPGMMTMHVTSLHCFRNDYPLLFGKVYRP